MSSITTVAYKPRVRRIVSVDGEGQTVDDRHAYVLLAGADDRGYRAYIEHDGSIHPAARHEGERYQGTAYHADDTTPNHGLPTERMLDFLLDIPQSKADLVISFSFTYDITKILQDLPWSALREFAANDMVLWNGYLIAGIPRKYFEVWKDGKHVKVWDTFTYWQMSFAKALKSSLSLFTDLQRDMISTIEIMKKERAHFDQLSDDDIREYCFNECECLSVMYRDFLCHVDDPPMRLTQTQHSGPGAVASAIFADWEITKSMPRGHHAHYLSGLPPDVARFSYYGGRFEIALQGLAGDLIEYDIQSAYPAEAVKLPCLRCGTFREVKEFVPGMLGFYYVGSNTTGPWAPFPFRATSETGREYLNRAHKGSIAFAHGGKRWVTSAEVETARNYFGKDAIPIYDGYVYEPGCNHKSPFARLAELYLLRKLGNPSEGLSKLIKLIINSVYGKLAQGIGWKLDKDAMYSLSNPQSYTPPKYQCYIWAAWITGGCRAKVLEAACLGGRKADCPQCKSGDMFRACEEHATVVSIATDGILSSENIPELYTHEYKLGSWERTPKPNAWLGMPGIYSFHDAGKPDECELCHATGNACDAHASDKKFKRRGLDSRYFPAPYLREVWERGDWWAYPIGDSECKECNKLRHACEEHGIRAFMPLRLAVTRTDGLDTMGEWIPMKKRITFASVTHKRNYEERPDDEFMVTHPKSIRLIPFTIPDDIRSMPYEPKATWNTVRAGKLDDPDIVMWNEDTTSPEIMETIGME